MTFVLQEQLALPEPPSSAHQRALSNGNAHPEVPATAAVAVPSLLEEPVTAPTPAPAPAPAPAPSAADLLGDLLAPLAIEAAPGTMPSDNSTALDLGLDAPGLVSGPAPTGQASGPADPLALALYDGPDTKVQVRT